MIILRIFKTTSKLGYIPTDRLKEKFSGNLMFHAKLHGFRLRSFPIFSADLTKIARNSAMTEVAGALQSMMEVKAQQAGGWRCRFCGKAEGEGYPPAHPKSSKIIPF